MWKHWLVEKVVVLSIVAQTQETHATSALPYYMTSMNANPNN